MSNKRKMQFSNSRNQSGTRTFAINWFIILSVPPFTPGTRQHSSQSYPWEEAVHHWGQTLADYLENIAQNTVRNRKNYPKPDKLCGSANENLVFLASTAMENGGSSPREIISMMVYQHLSLRRRKYDQLEKNQNNTEVMNWQAVVVLVRAGFWKGVSNYICQKRLMDTIPSHPLEMNREIRKSSMFCQCPKGFFNLCLQCVNEHSHGHTRTTHLSI